MFTRRLDETRSMIILERFSSAMVGKRNSAQALEDLSKYIGLWDVASTTLDREDFLQSVGAKHGIAFEMFLRGFLGSDEFPISDVVNTEWRRHTIDVSGRPPKVNSDGTRVQYRTGVRIHNSKFQIVDVEVCGPTNIVTNPQFFTSAGTHTWSTSAMRQPWTN